MTYDQWKTTPPEERWGVLMCTGCDGLASSGCEYCDECADELLAADAMVEFYQWEPWS